MNRSNTNILTTPAPTVPHSAQTLEAIENFVGEKLQFEPDKNAKIIAATKGNEEQWAKSITHNEDAARAAYEAEELAAISAHAEGRPSPIMHSFDFHRESQRQLNRVHQEAAARIRAQLGRCATRFLQRAIEFVERAR